MTPVIATLAIVGAVGLATCLFGIVVGVILGYQFGFDEGREVGYKEGSQIGGLEGRINMLHDSNRKAYRRTLQRQVVPDPVNGRRSDDVG